MRLTIPLNSPPKFHFWKDFGAGKKRRRYPFHKYWNLQWKRQILNAQIKDERIQLPEDARIVKAEDLVDIELPESTGIQFFNHPWPFNIVKDNATAKSKVYSYNIMTRFYRPEKDVLALTNTLLEPALSVPSNTQFDLIADELDTIKRRYAWAIKEDSSLYRLPRSREFPRIDQVPKVSFGIPKHRAELNVLTTLDDFVGTLVAQRCYKNGADVDYSTTRYNISYPNSVVPVERDGSIISLRLSNDLVSLSRSPVPLMNQAPELTLEKPLVSIHPRSWRSTLDQTDKYYKNYSFRLPIDSHVHTLMLTSRQSRSLQEYENFAKSVVHSFGMALQMARLQKNNAPFTTRATRDELLANEINNLDQLDRPVCLQAIVYDRNEGSFHFTRYQLNSTNLNSNIKNQSWYSGSITNLEEVIRFWVDFHIYGQEQNESIKAKLRV